MQLPVCLAIAALLFSFPCAVLAGETTDKGGPVKDSGIPCVKGGLTRNIGEVVGPIDAGSGSHYFLYIPKSLKEGR